MKKTFVHSQKGAALIVVLLLLVVITLIGVMAIRQSLTSLNVATNSQINELLRQSSDAVMLAFETTNQFSQLNSATGILGFIRQPENLNKELVFCFQKGQNLALNISQASLVQVNTSGQINSLAFGERGFCKPKENKFYTSKRNAVITQVTVKRAPVSNDQPFSNYVVGTDIVSAKTQNNDRFLIYATSLVPSVGGASKEKIYQCLSRYMSSQSAISALDDETTKKNLTVSTCLEQLGVPFNTQVAEYNYVTGFK